MIPAEEAPAKYVVEVQRYFLRQVVHSGSFALSDVWTAAIVQLATYWTRAITQSAATNVAEKSPCGRASMRPKRSRRTSTVTSVEQAIIAALKRLVNMLNGFLPRREAANNSAAARSTATSPP